MESTDFLMKKKLFTLIFLSLSAARGFTQFFGSQSSPHDFSLTVTPTVSYSQGVLNEIIYHSRDTSKKISLLEWERNVWLYGLDISTSYKRFHGDLSASSALPLSTGQMKDSDWLNTNDYSMKTTYSVGDIDSEGNYDVSLSLSFDAVKTPDFYLSPVISAQYAFDSFSRGKNAQGWYGQSEYSSDGKNHNWYDDEAKHFPTEYYWSEEKQKYVRQVLGGIDYYRHSFFSWLGLNAGFTLKKISMDFQALIAPFIYFSAEDTHHGASSDSIYHQIQYGYFSYFKISTSLFYQLTKNLQLGITTRILSGQTLKGDLYSDWYLNQYQPSGASTFELTTSLACKIKIY